VSFGRSHRRRRVADLALIAATSPIWVPTLVFVAAAVLMTSGRPILFVQERVGQNGESFRMRKFRSMINGDNPLIPDPNRITKIGALLRRSSLDELPQLLNVIEGSMTLVGPRPLLPAQVSKLDAAQRVRLSVAPGLTGLAQIHGRNSLSWDERFEFDIDWVRRPTLSRYIWILFRTGSIVISGDGVTGHDRNDRILYDVSNEPNDEIDARDRTTIELDAAPSHLVSTRGRPV